MRPKLRLHTLFWTDFLALLALIGLAATGIIIQYVLPPGTGGGGRGWRASKEGVKVLWGYARHQWGYAHYVIALVFVALMLLHIALHVAWIKAYFRRPGGGARTHTGRGEERRPQS